MHSSGVDEPVVSLKSAEQFIEAGADIVLVPESARFGALMINKSKKLWILHIQKEN